MLSVPYTLSTVMLNVIMRGVVMLTVVAPLIIWVEAEALN